VAVTNLPVEVKLIPRDKFEEGDRGGFRLDDAGPQIGTPYAMVRGAFKAPSGVPCAPPPWGELVAVDLAAGKIAWRRPLGSVEEAFPGIGRQAPGSVIFGGPIVTAGGLIFVGGSMDRRFRALAADTGQELWSAALPASAHALPITYEADGRQFVVIAAGGSAHLEEEVQGDALMAFALPEKAAPPESHTK
jgi:quinoprotein glucose dehydrogenase